MTTMQRVNILRPAMDLFRILSEKKPVILGKWLDCAFSAFPEGSALFFKGKGDGFDNPLGTMVRQSLEEVLSLFLVGRHVSEMSAPLERLAKVFAIQEMSASTALRHVFELRRIFRESLEGENYREEDLQRMERALDELALAAFDAYVLCRQRVFELRINDVKRSVSGLLRELHKRGFLEDPDEPVQGDGPGVCAARLSRGDDR